jgi:hypothetical protein
MQARIRFRQYTCPHPEISKPVKVLSVSADPAVSYTEVLLLLSQAWEVKTALSECYAHEWIQSHSFGIVVTGTGDLSRIGEGAAYTHV